MKTAWETFIKMVLFYAFQLLIVFLLSLIFGIILQIPIVGNIILFCFFSSDMQPNWLTVSMSVWGAFILMEIVSTKLFHDPTTNSDKWFSIILTAYGIFVLITKMINEGHIATSIQYIFVGVVMLAVLKK